MSDLLNKADNEQGEAAPVDPEVVETENTETEVVEEAAAENATKPDDIKKGYYASTALAEAQTEIEKVTTIASEHKLAVVFNFDTEKDFPAGYGVAIIPIAKRIKNENQVLGVAVAAVPDLETVAEHEAGKQFIVDAVVGNMMAKLANAVRPRGESGETASSIPYSVEDFISTNRPEGVLLAYRQFASAYVKVLKKKGLKFITESILRQTLQSAAFAEQQFPNVPQDKWIQILDSMIARAEHEKIAAGMLTEWKQTRNSATLQDKDVDLSDLDFDDVGEVVKPEQQPAQVSG